MTVRELPTKTDDSLGRVKTDDPDRPFPRVIDLDHEVSFDEVERWKDLLIELAKGGIGTDWRFFDDFFKATADVVWKHTVASAGEINELDGSHADADEGVGWIQLVSPTGADTATLRCDREFVRGDHSPVFRARVKVSADAAHGLPRFGLYSSADAGASAAFLEITGAGSVWRANCASVAGGGSASQTTTVVATPGWHDLRIEVDAGSAVRFYVDDVLISTLITANAMPRAADRMAPYFTTTFGQGSGGSYVIDYVDIRGVR